MLANFNTNEIRFVLLSHDKVTCCGNLTFRLLTAILPQAMGSTDCGTALCIMVVSCLFDIGETGRLMQERMKEHDRDIRITRTQNMPTEPDTSRYGTKLNLLTEKAIGTQGKGKIDSTQIT